MKEGPSWAIKKSHTVLPADQVRYLTDHTIMRLSRTSNGCNFEALVRARYIISADGAQLNRFSDPEGPNLGNHILTQMVSADVTFEPEHVGQLTIEGHINSMISADGFLMLTPFGNCFHSELTRNGKLVTKFVFHIISAIPKLIDMYGPASITSNLSLNLTPVKVDQLVWSTHFRTHSVVTDRTFTRLGAAIFLVGDATHIQSPAGGQGMNLAIRDAIFFTEAITKHIQAFAGDSDVDDTILRECAQVHHGRVLEIISFTKKLLKLASLTHDVYVWWMPFSLASIRDLMLRILGRFDFVQSSVAWSLSGLGRR
ncbi:uncharacterized protein EDB91DRAFT_1171061 [Suillus paluster]|uniref:uncharacterized protein n=1 Tax=Suillus paluster TaxID=48578 RepID=UPI001B876984|nr:uncharacterized protein EDB91DRAFT_1171061 [Suillus paluster]KAG1724313.1 hypothetical protein EDB91DRAFT_1171061 [Suillus paluster]